MRIPKHVVGAEVGGPVTPDGRDTGERATEPGSLPGGGRRSTREISKAGGRETQGAEPERSGPESLHLEVCIHTETTGLGSVLSRGCIFDHPVPSLPSPPPPAVLWVPP